MALSPYGDAASSGHEAFLRSEFGNWGLPQLPTAGELPMWRQPKAFAGELANCSRTAWSWLDLPPTAIPLHDSQRLCY
jgi:hypothetical protein